MYATIQLSQCAGKITNVLTLQIQYIGPLKMFISANICSVLSWERKYLCIITAKLWGRELWLSNTETENETSSSFLYFFHLGFVLNPLWVSCQTPHWRKNFSLHTRDSGWICMRTHVHNIIQSNAGTCVGGIATSSKPFAKNCSFVWLARTVILALRILSSSLLLAVHVLYEQKPACPRIPEIEQRWVGKLACEAPTEETLTARQDFFKKKKKSNLLCPLRNQLPRVLCWEVWRCSEVIHFGCCCHLI